MSTYTEGPLTLGKFASASGGPQIQYVNGSTAQQVFHCHPMDSADHFANARRLVACWNAFEGVETEKIDGKTVGEYVSGEVYLTGMQPAPHGGGFNIGLTGIGAQLLAEAMAAQFKGTGAINFLEVGLTHPETGDLIVTMQRVAGETPAQQKAAALAQRDCLLAAAQLALSECCDLIATPAGDALAAAIEKAIGKAP